MPKTKNNSQTPDGTPHTPVLVKEVLKYLAPTHGDKYLDLTGGYGGHAAAVKTAAGYLAQMTLVDRDRAAVGALKQAFGGEAEIIHSDFHSASQKLVSQKRCYDMILADLGASSQHLLTAGRGFSFREQGPLDMRMDIRQEATAADLVNNASQSELTRIIRQYGEEPRAAMIATAIIAARPIASTERLAEIVELAAPARFTSLRKIHPATRTFQALRIAVNDELTQISQSLPLWCELLAPGGRLVVISFHSLEDRLVKQFINEHAGNRYDARLTELTKKPITASNEEIVSNPRARSAKLRAAAAK